ncbi:SPRY domain-containing SOCS box protein 3 [Halotydeus destructor]|nr:SPRY domain-containing SOCS box protein 3 [Halotydeus destructor]
MSSSQESPRDSRRRRVAHFKNNWGTDVKQIDEEDSDEYSMENRSACRSPISPISSRRSSVSSLGSPSTSYSPTPIHVPRLDRVRQIANGDPVATVPLAPSAWLPRIPGAASGLNHNMMTSSEYRYSGCGCKRERNNMVTCDCGEEENKTYDWAWDASKSAGVQLKNSNRDVYFHSEYSCGTAAIRGDKPFEYDQFYWEIKMTSPVYGTDMMLGVGCGDVKLDRSEYTFCSLLGEDKDSWGLSYTGLFHHNNEVKCYSPKFSQGSIIGIHLDMWSGTLAFYRNKQPLGIIGTSLRGRGPLYPIVCSTAARTGMRLVRSKSFKSSLQYFCCVQLRKSIPQDRHVLDEVNLPPGLKNYLCKTLDWLLRPDPRFVGIRRQLDENIITAKTTKRSIDFAEQSSSPSECKKMREETDI